MNEKFSELIKLLKLEDIKILKSTENVLSYPPPNSGENIQIKTELAFLAEDPVFQEKSVAYRPKYTFTFSDGDEVFFKCEYVISVTFSAADMASAKSLLEDEDVKKTFLTRQLNRTLWSVLRGVVMDAFNRHSLRPVILPWIM